MLVELVSWYIFYSSAVDVQLEVNCPFATVALEIRNSANPYTSPDTILFVVGNPMFDKLAVATVGAASFLYFVRVVS